MNKFKIAIGSCIVFIAIIVIMLINIAKNNKDNNMMETNTNSKVNNQIAENKTSNSNIIVNDMQNVNNDNNTTTERDITTSFEDTTNEVDSTMKKNNIRNLYFAIENSLNNYFYYLKSERKEAVYSLINNNYISAKGITDNNVLNKIKKEENLRSFKVKEMYTIERLGSYSNYVMGVITKNDNEKYDWYGLIEADTEYKYYQITPYTKEEYKNKIDSKQADNVNEIKKNEYNVLNTTQINDSEMCKKYFDNYKEKMLNDTEEAYEILTDESKKDKFQDLNSYKQYIESKRNEISQSFLKESNIIEEELEGNYEYTYKYVLKDNNNNIYTIIENAIMDYEVKIGE